MSDVDKASIIKDMQELHLLQTTPLLKMKSHLVNKTSIRSLKARSWVSSEQSVGGSLDSAKVFKRYMVESNYGVRVINYREINIGLRLLLDEMNKVQVKALASMGYRI
ncbi:hypothetical protein M9H77_34324 [Catharanthus roseus]|uniref:Uncharacterized protein n=1 Tax=Catharanthus roseus TaxID=4058 RepID=A0ACB9ZKW9_CATRO|nr:hypothetical protein M9H77_34324 [Catharanthus roseus]